MADAFPAHDKVRLCTTHEEWYEREAGCPYCLDADLRKAILPLDPITRKTFPLARGVLDYFPRALAAVAEVSRIGNEQHSPGQPLHWDKSKSTDHADCLMRHLIERGTIDTDGARHSAKVAWRALALLEMELECSP